MSVLIVADLGINHQGSLDLAKRMIAVAKDCGVDVVKFQKRTIATVYTEAELAQPRPGPWGQTNGDLKRLLEFGPEQYDEIDAYCREVGMAWTASCWDLASVNFIYRYRPPFLKIASASLTDRDLLQQYKNTGVPLVLSTGMSTVPEIAAAVECLAGTELTLLGCSSSYPCPNEELNLLQIRTLHHLFKLPVGYSSHAISPWPMLAAVALGATMLEFHLTLDRTLWGSDQAASLEPEAVRKMVREVRDLEAALGDGEKRIMPSEIPVMKKLRKR